jgi:glycosyltransferase involved in cell wall biosynthesis
MFRIAGDPFPGYEYLVDDIKTFIRENQMESHVVYEGLVTDMDSFYNRVDLFVLPSTQPDPFPTVILEAMDHGLPVVATAHGGALEMIEENETGIWIPWDDAVESAKRIEELLNRSELDKMGELGRQRVHQLFSRESFEKQLLHVVETL